MNCCGDCKHQITWIEYGSYLADCGNKEAEQFIWSLDGEQDPGEAGCPFFEKRKEPEGEDNEIHI